MKHRIACRNIRFYRFTCSRIIAMAVALTYSTCPVVFAAERAKQEVKRIVSRELGRTLGTSQATKSLVDQIMAMPTSLSTIASEGLRVDRPEASYVFDHLVLDNGNASGRVVMYDTGGIAVGEFDIASLSVPNANRIDFSVAVATADRAWTEDGLLTGLQGDDGMGVASVSVDGGTTNSALVDFTGLVSPESSTASALPLLSFTPLAGAQAGTGGVASGTCPVDPYQDGGTYSSDGSAVASVAVCALVIVVVVIFVAITCLIFGWWGC